MSKKRPYSPKEARDLIGVGQLEVANAIGISDAQLSRLETGKRCWTLDVAADWVDFIHSRLEKLEPDVVDWERVPGELGDFKDLNELVTSWELMLDMIGGVDCE